MQKAKWLDHVHFKGEQPLRGCLYEPYRKGSPYLARSHVLFEILIKNCLRLHEKRASPPKRDLAIVYPRSRLVGLEISHIRNRGG